MRTNRTNCKFRICARFLCSKVILHRILIFVLCTYLKLFNISVMCKQGDNIEATKLTGVVGSSIGIPCNLDKNHMKTNSQQENQNLFANRISLILWYRHGSSGVPIYAVDARQNNITKSQHENYLDYEKIMLDEENNDHNQSNNFLYIDKDEQENEHVNKVFEKLKGRFFFNLNAYPAKLWIRNLKSEDAGEYRCRVDYRGERTQNFIVHLNLIVPPTSIQVFNSLGREEIDEKIGPFEENEYVILRCVTLGGKPLPQLNWYDGKNKLIDSSYNMDELSGKLENELDLGRLKRDNFDEKYECRAETSEKDSFEKKVVLIKKKIKIDLYLRPVKIILIEKLSTDGTITSINIKTRSNSKSISDSNENINNNSFSYDNSNNNSFSYDNSNNNSNINLKGLNGNRFKRKKTIREGDKVEFECISEGARPNAELIFLIDNKLLENVVGIIVEEKKSFNQSRAKFVMSVSRMDEGKKLTCRAYNSKLSLPDKGYIEKSIILNVEYLPQISVNFGSAIKKESIREGNDVYLECKIKSNPAVHEINWTLDGNNLVSNASEGILLINQTLIMQKIKKKQSGNYVCMARNDLGESKSDALQLAVRYKPKCRFEGKQVHNLAKNEIAELKCEFDGNPSEIDFKWKLVYNESNVMKQLKLNEFSNNKSESVLMFIVKDAQKSYGEVVCSGSNVEGESGEWQDACHFLILKEEQEIETNDLNIATLRTPCLSNDCEVKNSKNEIEIMCEKCSSVKSFYNSNRQNKDLNITYNLLVYRQDKFNNKLHKDIFLVQNLSNTREASFKIKNLKEATVYMLMLRAINSKGRKSQVRTFSLATLGKAERQMSTNEIEQVKLSALLLTLVGFVCLVVIFSIIIVVIIQKENIKRLDQQQQQQQHQQHHHHHHQQQQQHYHQLLVLGASSSLNTIDKDNASVNSQVQNVIEQEQQNKIKMKSERAIKTKEIELKDKMYTGAIRRREVILNDDQENMFKMIRLPRVTANVNNVNKINNVNRKMCNNYATAV